MAGQPESVAELFETALALKPSEREAFLDQACGRDSALRQTVENLLAQDARAGSFLQHPAFNFLDRAIMDDLPNAETIPMTISAGNPRSLEPGQILIDRFVIVRLIARGGMGEVYEAEDRLLQGVHVALKTILPHIADEPVLQKRFEREVLLAREVVHPNLCPIYDIFHCDQPAPSFLFLTMKLLPGETLATRLRGPTPISAEEGSAILRQTALGLAAIHAAGIVHRDIKPNNILLDGVGAGVRLWITDFGLARALEGDTTFSGRAAVAGTPGYIAPELFTGQQPSQASDLYAFGVVLHEVFTGVKPAIAPDSSSVTASPLLNTSRVPSFCSHLIRECLDLDPQRRCRAFQLALESLDLKRPTSKPWTRRAFLSTGAAGACAVAAGAWWEREAIYDLLHPLPEKRFVALLDWPRVSDNRVTPMLTGVLAAIKGELARLEAFDRNLFVIAPEDAHQDVSSAAHLKEVCDPLGTNLVMAASGMPGVNHFELLLRVLDPVSGHALRAKSLDCDLHSIPSLPAKAVQAAASLLGVSRYLKNREQMQPGTQSTAAFTAFQTAESLRKQPNDAGLDAAIEKYKEAVEIDPQYAIAYANLGIAYGHLYGIRRDQGALELARANCERALTLEPDLVEGHLALGGVLQQSGDEQGALNEFAKVLKLDPSNPRALVWQGQTYSRLNRWADAEAAFQEALRERPNSWWVYNELGVVLHEQGKFQDAIKALRSAVLATPKNAMAWSNLGFEYLQIGEFTEATSSLQKSLDLDPSFDQASQSMSLALRYQHKFAEALTFARKATKLNPGDDFNWLELGECYTSMGNHSNEARDTYLRAAKEAERRLQTDATDGQTWMRLALYRVKSGRSDDALAFVRKAESLGADDMDSQLYKARIMELLGDRDQALATLANCFSKGATGLQIAQFPDMQSLRKDRRYRQMQSKSVSAETGAPDKAKGI